MHDKSKKRGGTGFVDAHVHIADEAGLDEVLAAGVAAVRDAGLRKNADAGTGGPDRRGGKPIVVSSGWALYKKGGYGSFFGVPVEGREQIRLEIARLKSAGADIIKVMASGMVSLKNPGRITPGGFSGDELSFIVDEARRSGLDVMAHANGEPAIISCSGAGVRSIEHGFFMSRAALEGMAEKKIYWTPTVTALERAAEAGGVSHQARTFINGLILSHLEMMRYAHSIGVPLAVGTDCVLPHPHYKETYVAELVYLEKAGVPPERVIEIATRGGARLLGI